MNFAERLKPDNPILLLLSALFDILLLSLLTVICAAPIVTGGAALTAMHYVLFHRVRGDGTDVVRSFFRTLKENFMQATVLWLILMGMATAFIVAARRMGEGGNALAWGMLVFAAALFLGTAVYVFPLLARYDNGIAGTLRLALQIAVVSLPRTAAMVILLVAYGLFLYNIPTRFVPLVLVFGWAPVNELCARLYVPVLVKLENRKENG